MTSNKTNKRSQPLMDYQLAETINGQIDNAFDILFEETLKKYGDLTTNDN
ncbi:MAG: hypothetical protein ABIJ81_02830 [Patescibacteria group bacterium]